MLKSARDENLKTYAAAGTIGGGGGWMYVACIHVCVYRVHRARGGGCARRIHYSARPMPTPDGLIS